MADFVLKLVDLLIWPAVAVFGILLIRQPLKELVPTLKKLKYKELELEFEKETYELLEKVEEVVSHDEVGISVPEDSEAEYTKEKLGGEPPPMFSRVRMEPEEVVLHSWSLLEKDIKTSMHSNGFNVSPFSVTKIAQAMASQKLIESGHLSAIYKLQAMRNRLAHNAELVSDQSAENFATSVNAIRTVFAARND